MKKILLVFSLFLCIHVAFSQPSTTWSYKLGNAIISRWPTNINSMTGKGWEYSNSIILHGFEKVYMTQIAATPNPAYLTYIRNYVDSYVSSGGVVTGLGQSLDKIHPGILCLFLWERNNLDTKYKTAAKQIRDYLITTSGYPMTPNGGYWHKNTTGATGYDNVMMLDGMYMAHPFLVKYGVLFSDNTAVNTGVDQVLLLDGIVHDYTTHLAKHAWNYDKTKSWANGTTGLSPEVWSRALGWYAMALVDILKYLPTSHAKYNLVKNAFTDLAIGIKNTQDPTTGLWYQVVDKPALAGNYLETSGSAMFVYAIKTGVNMGLLNSATYSPVAQAGWNGIKTYKLTISGTDGGPVVNDFAPAMSVQGSAAAYVGFLPVDAPSAVHPHGYAAVLMAGSVMEFTPPGTLPVKFTGFSATRTGSDVLLKWENQDFHEVTDYTVERSLNGVDFTAVGHVKPQSVANNWTDVNAVAPVIYYRIKAVSLNNAIDYSKVVKVSGKDMPVAITASPNPIKNGVLNVVAEGLKTGSYHMVITNSSGQTVVEKDLYATQEKLTEVIKLPSTAKGLHYIQVKGFNMTLNTSVLVY
jgi:unsaturated rhamnogalacturonyl hydrolase